MLVVRRDRGRRPFRGASRGTVGQGGFGPEPGHPNLFGGSLGFMDMNAFFSEDELGVNIRGVTYSTTLEHEKLSLSLGFFLVESVPTVCSSGRHRWPGGFQHRHTAPRRPLQEGDERGPGGRPSPVRHLGEDGHIFGLDEVRDERDSEVPRGYGNDAPVDFETISLIISCKERFVSAQRLASLFPGTKGYFLMQGHERFRDLTACGGCPVHYRFW